MRTGIVIIAVMHLVVVYWMVNSKTFKLSDPHWWFDGEGRKQLVRAI